MRYILKAKDMNVFKDGRSFKNIKYAEEKLRELSFLLDEEISIEPIKDEMDFLKERLKEAEEVIAFYSDGVAFNPDFDDIREEQDSDWSEEHQMFFKGKKAREYFKKWKVKDA